MHTDLASAGTCASYIPNIGPEVQDQDREQTQLRPETILLVEDETYVLEITREVLEMCGYTVIGAQDAREAIRVFEENEGSIHLLITDVVMPGMNGRELAQRLTERCPRLKSIFISGYTDNAIVRNGFRDPNTVYLQKPFTLEALARKVREVIGGNLGNPRPARMN